MKKYCQFILLAALITLLSTACSIKKEEVLQVHSPDGKIKVSVFQNKGELAYSACKENIEILSPSRLGLKFKDGSVMGDKMKIVKTTTRTFNETWEQLWGEKRLIENRYEELSLTLKEKRGLKRELTMVFRVYNDGFGFRYQIPHRQKSIHS